eukprot:c6692_g1_i1.p1 GENE.c6692_g1_i1~~c6692_g1_i1.p1  ORF type:complete len:716 (+),score=197.96 c6692_g1_i1:44-2149(+)
MDVSQIHSIDDVMRLLKETESQEDSIRNEMEELVHECKGWLSDPNVTGVLGRLDSLDGVKKQLMDVDQSISHAAVLAAGITLNIHGIDVTQRRVEQTLSIVQDIMAMKSSVDVVENALTSGDLEQAALHIGHFAGREQEILESFQSDHEGDMLTQAKRKLIDTARQRLAGALSAEDPSSVVRFACLHPPLGIGDEGYHALKQFLVTYIQKKTSRSISDFHSRPKSKQNHISLVEELFDVVSQQVEAHEEKVVEAFGVQEWIAVVMSIKLQCDGQLKAILTMHDRDKKIQEKIRDVQQPHPTLTALELDPIVEDFAIIIKNCHVFENYMQTKAEKLALKVGVPGMGVDLMVSPDLENALTNASTTFATLEGFVLKDNINRAITMDRSRPVDEQNIGGSPCIDDVFFCLRKSTARAITSSHPRIAIALCELVRSVLLKELLELLRHHLGNAIAGTRVTVVTSVGDLVTPGWVVVLNNCQMAIDYCKKLCDFLSELCDRSFTSDKHKADVRKGIDSILACSKQLRKMLDRCIEKMLQVMSEHVTMMFQFEQLDLVSFDISEQEFAENEANDPFALALCNRIEQALHSAREDLVPEAFDALALVLIKQICTRMEKDIMKKRFTLLGGLQLDRDVRTITNLFVDLCHGGVRDQFLRLRSIATLLTVEKVTEAREILGETTTLTNDEVKRVLSLRTEFSATSIGLLN